MTSVYVKDGAGRAYEVDRKVLTRSPEVDDGWAGIILFLLALAMSLVVGTVIGRTMRVQCALAERVYGVEGGAMIYHDGTEPVALPEDWWDDDETPDALALDDAMYDFMADAIADARTDRMREYEL